MPTVDELFPEQPKSVDDLFPADVEKDRYRRQTLGTSPVQDLIFGDTTVNPIARVLDAFGQGAKQGWGAEPAGLSQESTDALKKWGIFNDYDAGQKSIIKAANESLFRGAAMFVVDPVMRGLPAAFRGTQAAVAQVGEEAGQEKLGREAAGAFEAFPAGLRAPTGIPHAAPHPMLAEIERAKSLGVIGAGEDGYLGTGPTAVAPPISTAQELPKAAGMPVDLFVETRDATVGAKPVTEPKPEPSLAAEPTPAEAAPVRPIAADVTEKLISAGRPEVEARASGELIASHYEARAERFGGERGTAEQLYTTEGPDIRGEKGAAPSRSEPIKPGEGDAGVVEPVKPAEVATEANYTKDKNGTIQYSSDSGDGALIIRQVPPGAATSRGMFVSDFSEEAAGKFVAIRVRDDLQQTLLPSGGWVSKPQKPRLFDTAEEAEAAAKKSLGLRDAEPIKPEPDRELAQKLETPVAEKSAPVTETPQFKNWFGGSKVTDESGAPVRVYHGTSRGGFDMFDTYASEHGLMGQGSYFTENPAVASEYTSKGAKKLERSGKEPAPSVYPTYLKIDHPLDMDVAPDLAKWEKAFPEYIDRETLGNAKTNEEVLRHVEDAIADEMIPKYEGSEIIQDGFRAMGHDGVTHIGGGRVDAEGVKHRVWIAFDPEQVKSATGNSGAFDPNSPKIFDQIKRGKITLRDDAKPIITLFKDANASTFVHETGHAWLEELMKDAEHPKAPGSLRDDADTVREWLGVHSAEDIKTSHHEKFARGFERYMMEGKAPNQALANVFEKFKNWLTKIYQTVTRLKSPINDEIRGVFDRLLTMHPSEVKIEPEGPAKTFADIHEADAEHTPPEMAHPAAETIQGERDSVAARHIPEDQNARLKNTPDQARRSEAGNQKPDRNADASGSDTGEAGNAEASGAVGAGGIEAPAESPRTPARPRTEPPVSAHDKFPDKAGNIRLDNLNTPEDLNQIIRQTAEENGDFQNVRGPVSDAQVLDLAEAAGVDAAFIDSRKLGEAWTAPQIVALRRLLIQSAQSVHDLAMKAATGSEAEVMAYAEAKARHQLIQERVSSVTAEAGRALRAFQSKFTEGVAGDVSAYLKEATGKTLFQLQQEAKFLSRLQTPQQTSKFVNDTSKATFRNAILEYYINALISGPFTHTRYAVGNAVGALFTPLVEIPFASVIGKAREIVSGEKVDRVHLGEAGAQLYGMIKGSRDGLTAAIQAFQDGVSPPLPGEKVSPHFAQANRAIPGKIGEILNIPSKSVAGIHSFFKSLRYEQNIQSQAYRTAMNEGLQGDAFASRIAELTTNPTEAMMTEATTGALKELYMAPTDYHSFMGSLTRATNSNLAAKIIVPFMKIGTQITRNAFIERTPLGILSKDVRENLSSNGPAADLQAGKILAGISLMGATVGMVLEGNVTGDGPTNPDQRKVWLLSHKPNTIQIGDLSMSYQGLGSLGMLMRFSANMTETAHALGDKDMNTLAMSFFEGFTTSVLDENFLRGVKDLTQAMYHPKEYGASYLKSQITNWLPWSVGSSQVARKIDPYSRETHGIFQAAQAKIPWLSEQLMPRRDMFGEPILNAGPNPEYANDPVVKAMDNLHVGVGKIGKKIRGVDLTEQQYDDLARVAGRMAKTRLNAMVGIISNPQVPAAQRVEMIHTAISSSREAARSLIMMQNPEIIKQATDAKIAKLRGEPAH